MRFWTVSTGRRDLSSPAPAGQPARTAYTPSGMAHAVDPDQDMVTGKTLCSRPLVGFMPPIDSDFEADGVIQSPWVTRCRECVDLLPPAA